MTLGDIAVLTDGERVTMEALTEEGEEFIDCWIGPLLQVLDVGRIVIPREAVSEFRKIAERRGVAVEPF